MTFYKDLQEFLKDKEGKIFRIWVFKRMFTPYEQEQKFSDDSLYEDSTASLVTIHEVIPLPDGDVLIGVRTIDFGDSDDKPYIEYYKLSELRINFNAEDSDKYDV